jgi:hypothetical protein
MAPLLLSMLPVALLLTFFLTWILRITKMDIYI